MSKKHLSGTKKNVFYVFLFIASAAWGQSNMAVIKSPNGQLVIMLETISNNQPAPAGGQLVYAVSFQGKALIDRSALSLELKGQKSLGSNVRIVNTYVSKIDETYQLVTGKVSSVHNYCNTLRVDLEENVSSARKLIIEARAYDDAIAFRYVVPEQANIDEFRLTNETTEFRISKDATGYSLILPNFRSMYEDEFVKLPISSFSNHHDGVAKAAIARIIGLPILMEVPGVAWMAITEADLRDYSSMYLINPSGGWSDHYFVSKLSPNVEFPNICVMGTLPHNSAWRVLMVGTEPGRLIESNVITSLNPPSAVKDISWIHSGKVSWDWWNGYIGLDGKSAHTTENIKYFVDFAAKSGLEYMLVDGGWNARNDITKPGKIDIPEIVRYAANKGVKVWIWVSYSDVVNRMDEVFPIYEKWGIAGLKIDFIERDDQDGNNFYYQAAEKAAQYHLMLDIHGSTKPSGINRTYPNLLSYEAVLGLEQSQVGTRDNPENHVTIPFTRMLAGPMDYTPGGFNNVTREEFAPRRHSPMVMGTRAHTLAMYVVYETPFQMVSDHPGAYEGQPSFQFIKDVPATWDETKVLSGLPGKYITIARRSGKDWFMGGMTNWEPRQDNVLLNFLGDGKYTAEIYSDAPDADRFPKNVVIEKKSVDRNTNLKLQLVTGGGYAIRFRPAH
ncbi:MAG TPA: glycoside hydrolase family 97 protein [Bacteroidales bacterium]|nr:glycoside hydrolase family 97 protein [Bacteroidales bacterium]